MKTYQSTCFYFPDDLNLEEMKWPGGDRDITESKAIANIGALISSSPVIIGYPRKLPNQIISILQHATLVPKA